MLLVHLTTSESVYLPCQMLDFLSLLNHNVQTICTGIPLKKINNVMFVMLFNVLYILKTMGKHFLRCAEMQLFSIFM